MLGVKQIKKEQIKQEKVSQKKLFLEGFEGLAASESSEVFDVEVVLHRRRRGVGVHQLEGQLAGYFPSDGAAVEPQAEGVGHEDPQAVVDATAGVADGGGAETRVLVLGVAVEGDPEATGVGDKGPEADGAGEGRAGDDGAAVAGLQGRHHARVVHVGHGDVHVLDDVGADGLHGLLRAVGDGDVGLDLVAVEVDVAAEADVEDEAARREGVVPADEELRLAVVRVDRGELDLTD